MSKQFNINYSEILLTDEMLAYNDLKLHFKDLSGKWQANFEEDYRKKYQKIEDVVQEVFDLGCVYIQKSVEEAINILAQQGVFDIDEKVFVNKYFDKYFDWEEEYQKVEDKYMAIVLEQQDLDEYRTARRHNRGKWQGGGFGLSGALVGATQAGAVNLATGAVHGLVNLGGKAISSAIAKSDKSKLFKDTGTLQTLADGVMNNCYKVHYALIDALRDKRITIGCYVTQPNSEKAQALFNNYSKGIIDKEQQAGILEEIITLNPYHYKVYEFIIKEYGDEKGEVDRLTQLLGLDMTYYKNKLVDQYYKALSVDTEQSTLESREKFIQYSKFLGVEDIKIYLDEMADILTEHDRKIRTVDEIEFSTRDEAKKAAEELSIIKRILAGISEEKEEILLEGLECLIHANITTCLNEKYQKQLEQRIQQAIQDADQAYMDIKFNLTELETEIELNQALENIKSIELRTIWIIENKVKDLEAKRELIIENQDRAFIEKIFETYLFLTPLHIEQVIHQIQSACIRTEKVKEEKIRWIQASSEKLIKQHSKHLEKAIQYEDHMNAPIVVKEEKSSFFGRLSKAISTSIDVVKDKLFIEDQKRSWEFVMQKQNVNIKGIIAARNHSLNQN
ncbi:hypothetical protein [Cellulosilyticum sp. I15G10I2]|uniref:hypothetical protein n=1 Tax=Cellulosilyticum sp. I15G10I2 TaxID=1892843 RepID=UPI00085CBBD4|nr:hypothetical protein [Cellulosilyticum sp. I15G10I2]